MLEFEPHLYKDEGLQKESPCVKYFLSKKLARESRFHCNDFSNSLPSFTAIKLSVNLKLLPNFLANS